MPHTAPRTVIAHLDMTRPGAGILLVSGSGRATSPQALLGRQDGKWSLEDSYGDDGRDNFLCLARTRKQVVAKYMTHLGLDSYVLRIQRDY